MQLLSRFKSVFKQKKKLQAEMTTEEVIEELINRLILKLKADGKSIARPDVANDFGSFTVYVHRLGTEDAFINIEKLCGNNSWNIKVKPFFNKF